MAQATAVIAKTRTSELGKQACGKALIDWATGVLDAARGGPSSGG